MRSHFDSFNTLTAILDFLETQ